MKPHRLSFMLLLCVACSPDVPEPVTGTVAITNVAIVDVRDGSIREGRTVVVDGDRISAIAAAAEIAVPAGARVLDGDGRWLIPGLWDAHVHSAASADRHFPLFVAHGVTSVRNLHTTVDSALELIASIRARQATGGLIGPRFLANGPIIDGPPSSWPGAVVASTPAEARAAVDSLIDGGADFIKVYDNLAPDVYLAIAEQAERRGVPFDGHVPFAVRPETAADAGQRTIEHLSGMESGCSTRADSIRAERRKAVALPFPDVIVALFRLERALYDTRDPDLCRSVIEAYARNGTAVVPNLVIHHNSNAPARVLDDASQMKFVAPAVRAEWERRAGPGPGDAIRPLLLPTMPRRMENVRLLHAAGVPILAGTDVGNPFLVPGISLHQELELLVEAGLSPLEALRSATLEPARVLGVADSLGTIEPGRLADLVLLDANPLDDIRNTRRIAAVVLEGVILDRARLDELLSGLEVGR